MRGSFDTVVVLGIGGSALGNIAIQTALRPIYWNLEDKKLRKGGLRLFVFDNVDVAQSMLGDGPNRQPLADKMSAAWVAFARTGNPNHKAIPKWSPFFKEESLYSVALFGNFAIRVQVALARPPLLSTFRSTTMFVGFPP